MKPIFFNFYIDDLIRSLERESIFIRGYAEDIVIGVKNKEELDRALEIIKEWCVNNRIKVNPNKSGILRIMLRKTKVAKIDNGLDIPEVGHYKYLGITTSQSLKFREEVNSLRCKEAYKTDQ